MGTAEMNKQREELAREKSGAVWLAMMDAGDLVNFSAIAREYFGRSSNWLLQRLHGYDVNGKPARFKPKETTRLVEALRDIASRLTAAADCIDRAQDD